MAVRKRENSLTLQSGTIWYFFHFQGAILTFELMPVNWTTDFIMEMWKPLIPNALKKALSLAFPLRLLKPEL